MQVIRTRRESELSGALLARTANHRQHLEADGEIINLDYDPLKIYAILKSANEDQFNAEFHTEIMEILRSCITLGSRVFKLIRSTSSYKTLHRMRQIFQKYRITDHIQGERHMAKAVTMPRIFRLFPHLVAKIVTMDLNIEGNIPENVLTENGLDNISPACFWRSSFCLITKYEEDVEDIQKRLNIVKAMLLCQYEQLEVVHKENKVRAANSEVAKMQAIFQNCQVLYDSNHILGTVRWAAYNAFFLKDPYSKEKYDYGTAGEIFDQKFTELVPIVESVFKLRSGTGIEIDTKMEQISQVLENLQPKKMMGILL